jgi:hypothetical protein
VRRPATVLQERARRRILLHRIRWVRAGGLRIPGRHWPIEATLIHLFPYQALPVLRRLPYSPSRGVAHDALEPGVPPDPLLVAKCRVEYAAGAV